jgi:CO/xanthine dehydrogenase Mo-binding subunit
VYFTLPGCGNNDGENANAAKAARGYAAFGNRIVVDASGVVTLNMGKVELGQGIGTAIAQVAAEELGIDFSRIRLESVDTDTSPDESYTFSSISVQQSAPPVRRAAAAGRQILLQRAADKLAVPVTDLSVEDGNILVAGSPSGVDYWQLLTAEHIEVVDDAEHAFVPIADYQLVGQSVQRLDIPGKVFGESSYLQDLRLPDMVHARVVRPPAERAQISDFDAAPVTNMPGVLGVVRDGNFLGVIAEREGQAQAAATALRKSVTWSMTDDLPGARHVYDWLTSAPTRIEPVASRGVSVSAESKTTDMSATYQRPFQVHGSISPSAAIASYQDGKLTVWSHAQGMYPLRTAISHTLGLEPEQVRCIHFEAAGCFGHNGADDAACDAAALAMHFPGKPIRLQWERADEFAWEPYGSAMHIETRAVLDESGRVRSWDFDIWSCPHTSRPRDTEKAGNLIYAQHKENPLDIPPPQSIPQPAGGADRNGIPLYAFENLNVTKHLVTEVPLRVSALRGLGAYGNIFAIESFMDELALSIGEDPLAFRLKHLQDPRAIALLERLADESNWSNRPAAGSGEGWGLAFARFKNLSSYVGIVYQLGVDSDSAAIELHRATAVCDAGLIINPDGVRAQIEGGIVQSSSWTLKEQLRFSESRIESRDWASYPILRFDEVPDVRVVLMSRDDEKSLGVGEAAQGPTAAAIANAVFHASGRRVRRLPLTPEQILSSEA